MGAENVVPVVMARSPRSTATTSPHASTAISAKITTEGLTALNKRVEVDHEDADAVAADWLEENGFASD